ncbi:phage minor structural protein [Oceanobacillus picturae]|uniref:Phage minor structural protein n=1 Tax=Oceanobacillus picturae TaxID=171693 RepID=A0A0U9H7B2_9BACI|nr:phage tail protein [Oceanobacillus picturae]GAQ18530.1 phage minor structural protein [Oceanobacillus picturae]
MPAIKVLTPDLKAVGQLENAYSISYKKPLNEIPTASFSLPLDDDKNGLCDAFNVVEIVDPINGEYVGLFRIMPALSVKDETREEATYTAYHVLSTLLDNVLFRYRQYTNIPTRTVIQSILDQQRPAKHWRLGTVDFTRYFHYKFENENGLAGPLFSIPEPFDDPYVWTWNTKAYPWTLNLVRPSNEIKGEIRFAKNMRGIERTVDPADITNRIYPLGAGEGINQVDIKDVNIGVPYIEDTASIAKNGLREFVWVDRRFENAGALKASAQSLLRQASVPKVSYTVQAADLSPLPEFNHEIINEGDLIRIIDPEFGTIEARVMKKSKSDITGAPYDMTLEIANKTDDIATLQADLERKQQINEVYSQGSTNIDSYTFNDNADSNFPAVIEFPFPSDMINVNESKLRIKTSKFRGYTRGSKAGGSYIKSSTVQSKSTASGGGTSRSTAGGGGTVKSSTTSSGGATTRTSSAGGDHRHRVFKYMTDGGSTPQRAYIAANGAGVHVQASTSEDLWTEGSSGNHTHSLQLPAHSHAFSFELENHSHSFQVPNHSHDFEVTIPAINIPDHTHDPIYGIYEHDDMPSSLTVRVDGKTVSFSGTSGEIDITDHLRKDSSGKITRDYHMIEVAPNDLARISMIVSNRFFVQSHIGTTV